MLARASSCRAPGSGPCLGLHRWAPALRYAPHIIGARALPHPRQPYRPLRCGTAAFRAAPDPDHPLPRRYALRAHAHLAQESPPPARLARSRRPRTRLTSGAALAARTLAAVARLHGAPRNLAEPRRPSLWRLRKAAEKAYTPLLSRRPRIGAQQSRLMFGAL